MAIDNTGHVPIESSDCFVLIDRYKDGFRGRVCAHNTMELSLVSNGRGAFRTVGLSTESMDDYDLVLLGEGVRHSYSQGMCTSRNIRHIAVYFSADLFGDMMTGKRLMEPLHTMLDKARGGGIRFGSGAVLRVFNKLDTMSEQPNRFMQLTTLMTVLNELALATDSQTVIDTCGEAPEAARTVPERVAKVERYVEENYRRDIRLNELSELAGMSPTAFSRYFKGATGGSVSDYIIDVRIGHAAGMLTQTTLSVAEVCFDCGFNNVSHFNRLFRKKKQCSPKEYRDRYRVHFVML